MSAFFVVSVNIKDREKFKEYGVGAAETIKKFGGKPLLKGSPLQVLNGDSVEHQTLTVVEFENDKMLQAWYSSEDYQLLIPLRDQAADVTIVSYTKL